jgi:hypothetical protein
VLPGRGFLSTVRVDRQSRGARMVGRGRSSWMAPPRCGCLRGTCPAPDGVSRACGARGHRAGGIRRSSDQRGRWRPVRQRRRHRRGTPLGWEAHWVQLWSCPPVGAVPCRGGDTPPGSPLRFAARSVQAGDILVWPVILRHLGRGHGRFAGSPATWRLLSPRGWGVHPRRSARPPALWS